MPRTITRWDANASDPPQFPTSEKVPDGLAGNLQRGNRMAAQGNLASFVSYDAVSPWLLVRPYISPQGITGLIGTNQQVVINVGATGGL